MDPNAEFGGTKARKRLEKRLLAKLDARMSILIVIYILNCVSRTPWMGFRLYRNAYPSQIDRNNAA